MWKKRLIWRNELVVINNDVSKDTVKSDRNDAVSLSSRDSFNNNTDRVSVRNGNFIPDTKGSLVISYHYVPLLNNNHIHDEDIQQKSEDMEEHVPDPEQDAPMDLSLIKIEMKEEAVTSRDQDSGYNPSPPLVVDLTNTPDEPEDLSKPKRTAIMPLPDHLVSRYPHLRLTNTGALVLWNFLWALVQDDNNAAIVRWVSVTDLEFQIVNKGLLAETWGKAKNLHGMDWNKVRKILDLYLRKKLIKLCSARAMVYQFLIVPRHVRRNHVQ